MRWKIALVNAGILVLVTLLSYLLLDTGLREVVSNAMERKQAVTQSLRAGSAQLALDGLRLERWLATQAISEPVQNVFKGGTPESRAESATQQANRLRDAAVQESDFAKMAPALVVFVDAAGVSIGRNGSNLMRGDKLGEAYPSLAESLKTGKTGSDLWLNRERQEQFLASYAPVRSAEGTVLGAVVVGTPLSDERLARTSELTSGAQLTLAVPGDSALEILASSASGKPEYVTISGGTALETAKGALGSGQPLVGDAPLAGSYYGAAPLTGYGDGKRAVLLSGVRASLVESRTQLLWPVFGVGLLGVVLVVMGGMLLGNYISRPVAEIEEGLLAIINGRTDLRFQIEHPDLGGLVFRLNSLLNALTGVQEDTTDDEGRPSRAGGGGGGFEGG